jgi:nitrate reductase NapAB chaperone NapD
MSIPNSDWSVAGLCVTARPDDLDAIEALLSSRPGVEVHARDDNAGRLVLVQEFNTVNDHRRNLEEIQALPGVLTAELVVHYRDFDRRTDERSSGGQ